MEKLLKLYKYIDGVNDVPFPNEEQQVITSDFRYDVKRMGGAPMITCTIMHVLCLDKIWDDNVYTYFNGERFYIKQVPSSSYDHTDSRYKHEVELVSERIVLDNVYFYDVVDEADYSKPVSNSTSFIFFGDIHEFAHRLNQSLKYSKVGYNVVVDDGISSEAKQVSFQDQVFSNVLQEAFNTYEIPYYFDGKTIHIGFTNNAITKTFKYGSKESLLSIQKQNANYKIVNRVTGVGSSDNIPYYYPNFDKKGVTRLLYNGEVGGVSVINQTKYKKVKLGTTFVYDANPTVTTELFNRKDYKLGYYSDLYTPEGEIKPGFTRFQVQFSYSFYLNEMQQVRLDLNSLSENSIRIDFTVVRQEGGYMEQFFDKNRFEGSLGQGTYNVLITWEFKDIMSPNAIQDWQMKEIIDRDFIAYGDTVKEGYTSWMYNNAPVKLYDYGMEVNVEPNDGDKITFERISYLKPQESLMPSIYRETNGENRFYNALNNTYVSPQTGEYYHFNNPYINGKPKEHIVNFEDIKPTIKGMTNSNGLRIDMFTEFAYDLNDNDEFDEEGNYLHPYFFGKLRRMDGAYGFNLFDHAIEEGEMVISMTSGSCGSCEWIIGVSEDRQENIVQVDERGNLLRDANGNVIRSGSAQPQQNDTINNEVWIALKKDISTFGVVMPNANANYKPQAGDTFVILHIDLPQAYILDAENRLKEELIKYMATNNDEKFNFSISFSRIFFAENPDILSQLNENSRIRIEYDNNTYELYISSYSYFMSKDTPLPEIRIELSDTLTIAQNALQNAISEVKDDILSNIGKSSDFLNQGLRHFLRKDINDRSRGVIASNKGFEVGKFTEGTLGSGAAIYKDESNSTHIEADYLKIRRKATFTTITVQELKHVGGEIILSPAAMVCSKVEESAKGWKCYFNTENSEGRRIYQEFEVNDLARCQTFNLSPKGTGDLVGNHYYWRKVVSIGDDYIELSKDDCDYLSDIPLEGDNISQLGNATNTERQAAIILSAYGADSPSYKQYKGVDGFSLEGKRVTKLSPYGNELTGVLNIEAGSKGWNNFEGLPDSIQNAVDLANKAQETIDGTTIGAVNLLQNSGFTGRYQSEDMIASDQLDNGSELFSKKLYKWDGDAIAYTDTNAVSGYSAQLGGISQSVKELIANESYVVSFKARGSLVNISCGDFEVEQKLTSGFAKYSFKFKFGGSKVFSIGGNARICDLQLERGTIATDWNPSPYDNDKAYEEFQSLKYLQDAIVNGNTSVLGGLILASMLKLGNYKDGKMQKVNAGVSGICNDENDVAFWAGGSFENAIKTMMKFKSNPYYKPTESEWTSLAKFVVSHGGDAVFRGTIFAENGVFRGRLEAEEGFLHGKFETSIEGNRIVIDPEDKSLKMYNGAGFEIFTMTFVDGGENWTWGEVNLKRYNYDSENEQGVLTFESRMTASDVDLYNRIDNTWTRMTTQGYQVTASANERHYNIITSLNKRYLDNANFVYVSSIQSDCWAVDADNVGIGEVYAEPEYDEEGTLLSRVLKVKV